MHLHLISSKLIIQKNHKNLKYKYIASQCIIYIRIKYHKIILMQASVKQVLNVQRVVKRRCVFTWVLPKRFRTCSFPYFNTCEGEYSINIGFGKAIHCERVVVKLYLSFLQRKDISRCSPKFLIDDRLN